MAEDDEFSLSEVELFVARVVTNVTDDLWPDGLVGERTNGTLRLTNLAQRRPDNVNLATLRGVFTTHDGAVAWLELDGLATLRPEDEARVLVTTCRFRTRDERYGWLNTVFGVLEGVLDSVGVGGVARGTLFECRVTVS